MISKLKLINIHQLHPSWKERQLIFTNAFFTQVTLLNDRVNMTLVIFYSVSISCNKVHTVADWAKKNCEFSQNGGREFKNLRPPVF